MIPWSIRAGRAGRSFLCLMIVCAHGCRDAERPSPWTPRALAPATFSKTTQEMTARWNGPDGPAVPSDQLVQQASASFAKYPSRENAFSLAELHYAAGLKAAEAHAETCVDSFYHAAAFAYQHLFGEGQADAQADERMRDVYNSSLARIIEEGQLHGRLVPGKHLTIKTSAGPKTIPFALKAGPWQLEDVDQLVVVGDYEPIDFSRRLARPGLGVPVVALRHHRGDGSLRDEFLLKKHPFAVTAVLHPDPGVLEPKGVVTAALQDRPGPVLALHDAADVAELTVGERQMPLAAELSAPLQYSVESVRRLRFDLLGFRQPGRAAKMSGLFLTEPYQRGKLLVVFVHGLLSDAHTWDEMLNELRADPVLRARYQFAVYMYPTGNPFLISAGNLRRELRALQKLNDPSNPDPALGEIVLVGHSMGGVLARFQVTRSEDKVWSLIARRPFEEIQGPESTRQLLYDSFFFDAQPFVKRAIFIATPHRGSTLARNIVGRIGASLVTPPREIVQTRDVLVAANPDTFNPALVTHLPTSVEDLAAGSPILDVMQKLPFGQHVRLHSIIGRGTLFPLLRPGDGCVPVSSARLDGVESELFVEAGHTYIHRDPESVGEVRRILHMHVAEQTN